MGKSIFYFLSSHRNSIPIFLIIILSSSPVVLLYSSAVSFVAIAPVLSRTSVVHHGGQWSIPSIPETTRSIARPLPVLHQTQFPFFLTKRLFMLFAAIKSYSFYLTFWLWNELRHLRILGSCFYYRQGERMKKIECARENILIRSS